MTRTRLVSFLLLSALFCSSPAWATGGELISETMAAQHGLTRPWFTQVALDQGRGQLRDLILYDGTLYAQTDTATIHAIDAETGKTLWSKQVGQTNHPTMTPTANRDLLAVVNGSRLFVLNRITGDLLFEKEVNGAPGAGAALSAKRVYVPMTSGMVVAYRMDPVAEPGHEAAKAKKSPTPEEKTQLDAERRQNLRLQQKTIPPLFCQSPGQVVVQPLVTRENSKEEYVVWPTDRGYLNFGCVDRHAENFLTLKYRLQTGAPIVGRPAYLPPDPKVTGDSGLIVAASNDGFVHAIQEKTGQVAWRFSSGESIVESPAVFDNHVYVTTQVGGMFCLATKTGKELWSAPNLVQFVAASKNRVYSEDRIGNLMVLNSASGARLDTINTGSAPVKLLNTNTDRIYLADNTGLIQCLHEVEQSEPLLHGINRKQVEEIEEKPATPHKEISDAPKKEHAAPKEHVAPKEKPAPREKPAPKEHVKKTAKGKKGMDDGMGNAFGQPGGDQFGGPGPAAGKAGKAVKNKKGKNANAF